jgi:hypothetical protein
LKKIIDIKFNALTVEALARAFFDVLDVEMSTEEMREVCRRNAAEPNPLICHTHDFCDANVVMETAWGKVEGLPPLDIQDDAQRDLWSQAWAECKRQYLQP